MKILIVEDEALTAMMLSSTLHEMGYFDTKIVATGESAIVKAAEEKPDIILMDIHLAGVMDGIEAAKKIQAQQSTVIVFMTGYSSKEILSHANDLKPLCFLEKPLDISKLKDLLDGIPKKDQ